MAELFIKQAKQYAAARPSYPPELFRYIASKTPVHNLAWDVGTGSGQAARWLAKTYKNVVATDTSLKQLEFAPNIPNVRYQHTPPIMPLTDLERDVAAESTVDLVTVAQALHWFDLPTFYAHVRHVLKKPNGVIAVWCYTNPEVNAAVDGVFRRFYNDKLGPYWDPARRLVEEEYRSIEFPFESLGDDVADDGVPGDGPNGDDMTGDTGPFRFVAAKEMVVEEYLTYLSSSSAYQTAKGEGVELLTGKVAAEFSHAWKEDGEEKKAVTFPVYLRIGKVGNSV